MNELLELCCALLSLALLLVLHIRAIINNNVDYVKDYALYKIMEGKND